VAHVLWTTRDEAKGGASIVAVPELPNPDRYHGTVLGHARPGIDRVEPGPVAAWQSWWQSCLSGTEAPLVLAGGQGFVVTTAQLHACGWARHDLRRELRRAAWWIPSRGTASPVVVAGDDFQARRRQHAIRASAAVLGRPAHLISGTSAAILHGLPTMSIPTIPGLTSLADDWLGRRSASHLRHAAVTADDETTWFGAPVTTVARTVVDVARHDRRSAIMAADAALREDIVTRTELDSALLRARGWPGVRLAREIVALADPDAESPLESVVRLALDDDGFPPPKLQCVIAGYRVDFLWPEYRLILEADGREKYTKDELWKEKRRETALRRTDHWVERVIWTDFYDGGWAAVRRRLWAHIRH
jgi:very-short-patch-repair endonuclease